MDQEPMFDGILHERIGGGGRWQWKVFLLTAIASNMAWVLFPTFAFEVPRYHCRNPFFERLGWSYNDIVAMTTPDGWRYKNHSAIPSACRRYAMRYLRRAIGNRNVTYEEAVVMRGKVYRNVSRIKQFGCKHGWIYDPRGRIFEHSMGIEFNIVCDRRKWILITTTLYSVGMMAGYVIAGLLADVYGRKKTGMFFGSISFVFGIGAAVSNSIELFALLRAISGFLISGIFITTSVLVAECTDRKYRNIFNALQSIYFCTLVSGGYALVSYLFQDWRFVQLLISLPAATAAMFVWFIPESPRWLIAKGYNDEARQTIEQAILSNSGKEQLDNVICTNTLPEGSMRTVIRPHGHDRAASTDTDQLCCCCCRCCAKTRFAPVLLLAHRSLCARFLGTSVIFVAVLTCNYGLASSSIEFDNAGPYVNYVANAAISLPSCVVGLLLFHFFDRRRPFIALAAVTAVFSLANALVIHLANADRTQRSIKLTPELHWLVNVNSIVIVGCTYALMDMKNVRAMEIFPTAIRNSAYGLIHGVGRGGMALGLYLNTMHDYLWQPLHMYVYFVCALLIVLMVVLSPEEEGHVLMDSVLQLDRQLAQEREKREARKQEKRERSRRRPTSLASSVDQHGDPYDPSLPSERTSML